MMKGYTKLHNPRQNSGAYIPIYTRSMKQTEWAGIVEREGGIAARSAHNIVAGEGGARTRTCGQEWQSSCQHHLHVFMHVPVSHKPDLYWNLSSRSPIMIVHFPIQASWLCYPPFYISTLLLHSFVSGWIPGTPGHHQGSAVSSHTGIPLPFRGNTWYILPPYCFHFPGRNPVTEHHLQGSIVPSNIIDSLSTLLDHQYYLLSQFCIYVV